MGLKDLFKKRDDGRGASDAGEVSGWIAKLSDPDWKVRMAACQALGKLGPRAQVAAPKLQELIDDDNGDVCNAAAAALSEIER
jgi:HEAT repeat protein